MGRFAMVASGAAILLCAAASPAAAQTVASDGRTVFDAAYFTTYSPSTAFDIVQRAPGFSLDLGNQDVRGFGQAAGNVVINGARPSSKSDTLETILRRIPASRVLRVEIGPGDLFGSEYSGKPQVLNLVLTTGGGLAGTVDATVRRDYTGRLTPAGEVSALLRRGPSTFNASLGYRNYFDTEEGSDTLRLLPSGDLFEYRRKINDIHNQEAFVTGSWAHVAGDNREAHINFRLAKSFFDLDQSNAVTPAGGPVRNDELHQNYRGRAFEIGADITRPLWGGGIKLIGLVTRRHGDQFDTSVNQIGTAVLGGFEQGNISDRDESVVRLRWSRGNWGGWSVETGVEGALNRLASDVNLQLVNPDGSRTRIDLPVDQVVVEEYRGEAYVNAGRALARTLRMDLSLNYEASRLTVRGDTMASRTLSFIKPKASFDWRPGHAWHVQFSASRTVAQLDFGDFISTADLASDRVNGGNAELRPQRAWELLTTVERPIFGDGLAKVEVGYNRIEKVQDRVPLPEGLDAPGNLGSGTQYFVRGTLDAPLGWLGITGGRLTAHGYAQNTSVVDPYTLRSRPFSGAQPWNWDASFRQDLGKFAWGFSLFGGGPQTFYRLNEIDAPDGQDPYVQAFAEYRPTRATTVTFSLDNLGQVAGTRNRLFFEPTRASSIATMSEFRERNQHIRLSINLKQSFG